MIPDPNRSIADRSEFEDDPNDRESFVFELPITFLDRQRVEQLLLASDDGAQDADYLERARFNALATLAIAQYCKYIGLVPDLDHSRLWTMQDFSQSDLEDVADLPLADGRTLECRPYRTGESSVFVPRSVWRDRDGFLAVEISDDLRQAKISGFLTALDRESSESIPLDRWADLTLFFNALLAAPQEDASPALSPVSTAASSSRDALDAGKALDANPINQLDDWFSDLVEAGWLTLEDMKRQLGLPASELSFRSGEAQERASSYATRSATWTKLLEFPATDATPAGRPLRLGFSVKTTAIDGKTREVSCQVVPAADCEALPTALTLSLLDETGETLNRAKPKGSDSFGFRLTLERGEEFSVCVALGEAEYIEHFVG